MKKIVIAYLGGGSKDWAHKYFGDLLSSGKIGGQLRLFDIDKKAAERNCRYFSKLQSNKKNKVLSDWTCMVTDNLEDTLLGADFVIISVLPCSLKYMKTDVHLPEKYGIWQSVGDTVGPGGYSRAIRTIPIFVDFAKAIREHCPQAWVINYTNPLAMCVQTLYEIFPEIKAFGCCHEVFGLQKLLGAILGLFNSLSDEGQEAFMSGDLNQIKKELKGKGRKFENKYGHEPIARDQIKVNVQGINHFTWVNEASYEGQDLFEIYRAYIKLFRLNNRKRIKKHTPGFLKMKRNYESVKFELFEKHGQMAAAGDRHLAEFIPSVYLPDSKVLKHGFVLTPVWARQFYNLLLKLRLLIRISPFIRVKIKTSGEEGVRQIEALSGLGDLVSNVNLPNTGQAADLPIGAVVETNAEFSKDKLLAINAGYMKEEVAELVRPHAENQHEFVKAYLDGDPSKIEEVFLKDPAVRRIGNKKAKALFLEMMDKNKACHEDFLK
ncbi:MAG: alpha-glucosidase/alpha-galactosidase [Clostridiales bacterium]|nr:alpha-glucosidase/alpha-galactosidase [Clostridiales bacterium]